MKISSVAVNNRKAQLEVTVRSGKVLPIPFAKLDPRPSTDDRLARAYVDKELANEAVTYVLRLRRGGIRAHRPCARLQ